MTESKIQSIEKDGAFRLDGRTCIKVTGGASGIGEGTARELVRAGAFVWIADINVTAAVGLAKELGSAQALLLDVTSQESIAAAGTKLDRLDILVNNAGIGHVGSIETTEPEDFDRLLDVNVRSVYLVTRAFLPMLFAAREYHEAVGAIVNIGSVSRNGRHQATLCILHEQGCGAVDDYGSSPLSIQRRCA